MINLKAKTVRKQLKNIKNAFLKIEEGENLNVCWHDPCDFYTGYN